MDDNIRPALKRIDDMLREYEQVALSITSRCDHAFLSCGSCTALGACRVFHVLLLQAPSLNLEPPMQVSAGLAEEGADVDKLMARMDELQTRIDAANGWEIERTLQRATDALRCPPGLSAPHMQGPPCCRMHTVMQPLICLLSAPRCRCSL